MGHVADAPHGACPERQFWRRGCVGWSGRGRRYSDRPPPERQAADYEEGDARHVTLAAVHPRRCRFVRRSERASLARTHLISMPDPPRPTGRYGEIWRAATCEPSLRVAPSAVGAEIVGARRSMSLGSTVAVCGAGKYSAVWCVLRASWWPRSLVRRWGWIGPVRIGSRGGYPSTSS
jgi:hypothetical protein